MSTEESLFLSHSSELNSGSCCCCKHTLQRMLDLFPSTLLMDQLSGSVACVSEKFDGSFFFHFFEIRNVLNLAWAKMKCCSKCKLMSPKSAKVRFLTKSVTNNLIQSFLICIHHIGTQPALDKVCLLILKFD